MIRRSAGGAEKARKKHAAGSASHFDFAKTLLIRISIGEPFSPPILTRAGPRSSLMAAKPINFFLVPAPLERLLLMKSMTRRVIPNRMSEAQNRKYETRTNVSDFERHFAVLSGGLLPTRSERFVRAYG